MHPAHPTPAGTLNARDFIAKWGPGGPAHALTDRAGAQAHFLDRCRLLALSLACSAAPTVPNATAAAA